MNKLLGIEVKDITNSKLLRFAQKKGFTDLSFLSNLGVADCVDLLNFNQPELTIEAMEAAIDENIDFTNTLCQCVIDAMNILAKKKKK